MEEKIKNLQEVMEFTKFNIERNERLGKCNKASLKNLAKNEDKLAKLLKD